jgi:phosphohistidine phosphatase
MKTIYLVRHAKSSWKDANTSDFDRPLNHRGMKSAPLMAEKLKAMGVRPDHVISSPANRAISTAELFCETFDYPSEQIVQRMEIYEGRASQMLTIVQEIPESVTTALFFGHNPTITEFANLLAGSHLEGMETCGVVRIDLDITSWKEAAPGKGRKVWYEFPKKSQE